MSATAQRPAGTPPGVSAELLTALDLYYWEHRLRAVDLAPAPGGAVAASVQIGSGGFNKLHGWSIAETTGANPAQIRLHDGASGGAAVISGRINLVPGESVRDILDRHGILITTGQLYLEVITGSVEGVVYVL